MLFAAFYPALVDPLGAPQLDTKGLHIHWYVAPSSWSCIYWGRHSGRAYRIQSFGFCGLLRGLRGSRRTRADARLTGKRFG